MKAFALCLGFVAAMCLPSVAGAQSGGSENKEYMYEIGAGGGISWAYGDVNHSSLIANPSWAADLLFRYNWTPRWAFAVDVSSLGLKGDTRNYSDVYPGGADYRFNARLWELSVRPEFHFWNYGWASDYREKRRIAPFLTLGLGFGYARRSTDMCKKSAIAFTIPIGGGFKWKIAPRWNAQLTALWTKAFSDNIDGIDDPYGIDSGALQNTDWTGQIMLSVTFDFKERCLECKNQHSLY